MDSIRECHCHGGGGYFMQNTVWDNFMGQDIQMNAKIHVFYLEHCAVAIISQNQNNIIV